ncbi:BTAD domain-containing putative transcriptional regulator [Cryptosporangium minutisporangium]|uniref:OmpR/PhoB-type domain-containing protein n=1 Tax=Cryptosporangium minutisporangium TaxID=113569 RepID=A0ABP6T8B8_9ACTN
MEDALRFAVLGPLRIWRGDEELDLGPSKQRGVLAVLLLNANRAVPAHRIVDAVWDDEPPANGANVVQKYVAALRRVLEPDRSPRAPSQVLKLDDGGYRLSVADLDAQTFETLVRGAETRRRDGDAEGAAAALRQAVELWHGQPLAGLPGRWFDAARRRLADGYAAAWESLAEIELERGRHARLATELERLADEFPGREGLRAALMLALYRSGRQVEALAAYRSAQQYLGEEFGVDPGARLQELHQGILASDPMLLPPSQSGWPPPAQDVPSRPEPTPPPPVRQALPLPGPPSTTSFGVPGAVFERPPYLGPLGPLPPSPVLTWVTWMKALLLTAVPVCTFGTMTWALIGYLAVRRCSLPNAICAALYLVVTVLWIVGVANSPVDGPNPPWTIWDTMALPGWIFPPFVGAAHVFALVITEAQQTVTTSHDDAAEITARMDRERALQILTHHPEMARELRIGRPDLPRWFSDGGLVDVNAAPEYVLVRVPGVTFDLSGRILRDRERNGPYQSLYDLVARHPDLRLHVEALHRLVVMHPTPFNSTWAPGPP